MINQHFTTINQFLAFWLVKTFDMATAYESITNVGKLESILQEAIVNLFIFTAFEIVCIGGSWLTSVFTFCFIRIQLKINKITNWLKTFKIFLILLIQNVYSVALFIQHYLRHQLPICFQISGWQKCSYILCKI